MNDLVIIGAGGIGKEAIGIIEQINEYNSTYRILGFIDDSKEKWNTKIMGYKVLGGIDYLKDIDYKGCAVIAIANYKHKKNIVNILSKQEIDFPIIKHPNLRLHRTIEIGEGSILYEGIVISPNVKLGKHIIVSPKCGIGHDSVIEDYVSLLWNVNISGNDYIEEGVLFGSGSTIIQGKKVKSGSIIGAGAVVVNDINHIGTFAGIPAKIIGVK